MLTEYRMDIYYFTVMFICFYIVAKGALTCAPGWAGFDQSCYLFGDIPITFEEAIDFCSSHGGYVVALETPQENTFVKNIAKGQGWIGLTDQVEEGTYIWWYDNTTTTYSDWAPGEPNDVFSITQDCVALYSRYGGKWSDEHCLWTHSPICEEIDECESNPCMNQATCVDGLNTYTCMCTEAFTGNDCKTEINECESNPCMNQATCVDGLNTYTCLCTEAFTGTVCEIEINECESNPCMNQATCVDGLNTYTCLCTEAFTGNECEIVLAWRLTELQAYCTSPTFSTATTTDGMTADPLTSSSDPSSDVNVGMVVGLIIAGAVAAFVIITLVIMYKRRKFKLRRHASRTSVTSSEYVEGRIADDHYAVIDDRIVYRRRQSMLRRNDSRTSAATSECVEGRFADATYADFDDIMTDPQNNGYSNDGFLHDINGTMSTTTSPLPHEDISTDYDSVAHVDKCGHTGTLTGETNDNSLE